MAVRYVTTGQAPDYRIEVRGPIAEVLQATANPGSYACPEDVTGTYLEMGSDGKWTGPSVGTLTHAQADTLKASGAMASVKLGTPATVNGSPVVWRGQGAGGWVETTTPSSLGFFSSYTSLPSVANNGDIAYIPQLVGSESIRMRYNLTANRWAVDVGQTIAFAVDPFAVVAGSAGSYDRDFCTIPANMWGVGEEWEFTQPTEAAPTLVGAVSSRMLFGAFAGTVFNATQNGRNAAIEAFIRYGTTVKRTKLMQQASIDGGISAIAPDLTADLTYKHRISLASTGDSCYIRYSRITRIG